MYPIQRISHSEFVPIRGLEYHVRVWGQPTPGTPPLVLLHGWMDVAASYQFVVDAFKEDHFIIAPDWRGFGLTASGGVDCFWHPDYLSDLEALLDHYAGTTPVNLVGHSMGANIAMMYAGVRPERIRQLVNLEGFGLPATRPAQAPSRYAKWLDEIKTLNQGNMRLKSYPSLEAVAARLVKNNPRLSADKATWLAAHWSAETSPGQWTILGEAAHKVVSAHLYREDEALALYASITAPVLMVEAEEDGIALWWKGQFTLAEHHARLKSVPNVQICQLSDCGHMLHHDQPAALAALMERFWASS